MAKRRAEHALLLLHGSPSKTRCRSGVHTQLQQQPGSVAPSPPALLHLLGSRKRPHCSEEEEPGDEEAEAAEEEAAEALYLQATHCDMKKHAASVSATVQTSGNSKKRPREDSTVSETVAPEDNEQADEDTNAEDCAYNSFQFWRTPLPELDLSLLEDAADHSQTTKDKSKVSSSSDAMET